MSSGERFPIALAVLLGTAVADEVTDPGQAWLFPATTGVQAFWRPDLGLPGEAAPDRPLFDLATQRVTETSLGLRTWTDRVRTDSSSSDEEHTAFWTETLVPIPGGGLFGFDGYDLRENLAAQAPDGHRETYLTPAGIRFGGAWDLLYPFQPDHWASLGVEAWLPAWSVGETSLRTGLRLGSGFRVDLGVGWHQAGIQACQDSSLSTCDDTLQLGSLRRTWDARIAWNLDSIQTQVWGGWRTLDPRGDSTCWRQFARIGFLGIQSQGAVGPVRLDGEVRWESGNERVEMFRYGMENTSSLDHASLAASLQVEPVSAWSIGTPRLTLEGTVLEDDETARSTSDSLWLLAIPSGGAAVGKSSVTRFGIVGQWAFLWDAWRIAPELGWDRIERQGNLSTLWSAGLGNLEVDGGRALGSVWVPGAEVSWDRAGSLWSYRLTCPWSEGAVQMGWRHDIRLSQTF
jgi:hypothetical protein